MTCKKIEKKFFFSANKTHYILNKNDKKAVLIWVSCPPNF